MSIKGVYKIRNLKTGRVYIGSSNDMSRRVNQHLQDLKAGRHSNHLLQQDFLLYGNNSFTSEVVFEAHENHTREFLYEKEQYYLDKAFKTGNCYNILKDARGHLNRPVKRYDSGSLFMLRVLALLAGAIVGLFFCWWLL